MKTLTDEIVQAVKESSRPDVREQAIVDRHKTAARKESLFQEIAQGEAELEIEDRRQKRAYAEKPPTALAQMTVDPAREMLANLGDRARVLDVYRKLSPEQRQEAIKLAPGIAQIGGDDRGGFTGRAGSAVARGITGVSQPIMEMFGGGGSAEEIEFIRKLEGAAAQEFNPARPGDPWYERGPVQALEMLPWMATTVGGAGLGRAAATGIASRVATSAAAGSKVAGMAQKAGQVVGSLPTKVPGVGKYIPALTAGKAGELAGITAAAFPAQYAQEVDQLKAIGMVDDTRLRLLAGGTAAVTGLVEGIVPNPFGGKVSLTEGAAKAARQYLWEAAKKAPGELTEEYLQGVVSGLGEHVAQHIGSETETKDAEGNVVKTNPAQKKTIADAFSKGWKQTQEAALPMAFLLGGSAIGGTAMSAARATNAPPVGQIGDTMSPTVPPVQPLPDRIAKLEEVTSKGFVSEEDAAAIGIAGANRKERLANAKSEIEQLKALAASQPPPATVEPTEVQPATPPPLPVTKQPAGNTASPPPLPTQPAKPEAEASGGDTFMEYANAWNESSAKRRNVPTKPLTESSITSLKDMVNSLSEEAIQKGRSVKFASDDPALDDLQMREVQNAVRAKGYDVGDVTRTKENGVENVGFEIIGKTVKSKEVEPNGDIVSPTDSAPTKGAVGERVKMMGTPVTRSDLRTDMFNVRHELFESEDGKSGIVSSVDEDSGSVISMKKYPSIAAAKNAFSKAAGESEAGQSAGDAMSPIVEQPKNQGEKSVESNEQAGWDVIQDTSPAGGGKLYRQDPNPNLKPSQRTATRVAVDPSEGVVLVTKDQFGNAIQPSTLEARKEFIDGAKEGATFRRPGFNKNALFEVGKDGKIYSIESNSKRESGSVQELANVIQPGDIKELTRPSAAAEKTMPDSPAKRSYRKDNPSEAKAGDIVSPESKRDQEKQDAPKTKGGGDPNEVQTEGGQKPTEGQVSPKDEGQTTGETPSPDSSSDYEWKKGNNGIEAKGLKGYIRLVPAKDQMSMDGPAQDAYWISAPTAQSQEPKMQTETRYGSLDEAKKKLIEANEKYGQKQESPKTSENVPARSDKSSELDSKPVKQPEGVGSVAPESGGAALPASEQSQDDAALEAMIRAEFEKQMGAAKPEPPANAEPAEFVEISQPVMAGLPQSQPLELLSPSEYRTTLAKPTIKAIDLATNQLTDMEIEHSVLEAILSDGLKQNSILTQERRESAWLKKLLDCLES